MEFMGGYSGVKLCVIKEALGGGSQYFVWGSFSCERDCSFVEILSN